MSLKETNGIASGCTRRYRIGTLFVPEGDALSYASPSGTARAWAFVCRVAPDAIESIAFSDHSWIYEQFLKRIEGFYHNRSSPSSQSLVISHHKASPCHAPKRA